MVKSDEIWRKLLAVTKDIHTSSVNILHSPDLMSETQTVMRSSSSSMPASRNSPITMSRISSTSILQPIRSQYYSVSQSEVSIVSANHSPPAAAVCVEGGEDPVEFVLGGVELVHAVGLGKSTLSMDIE